VIEVDVWGQVLSTFTDVKLPVHLSLDTEDRVFVADSSNHRILLLSCELQLERVIVDTGSQLLMWKPKHSCYNELTSQLYVLHNSTSKRQLPWPDVVTKINLR